MLAAIGINAAQPANKIAFVRRPIMKAPGD
jgi:hypothetical protein